MGGQLFSAPKMDSETYYRTCSHVCNTLTKKLNRYSIIPECFIKKTSHGDIDCLLDFPLLTDEELSSHFGVSDDQIHHNSSVISIFYQNSIQIDFCHFEPENLVSAYNYMSNSDCGNMVGQMSRYSTGYRLTHKGLMYPVRLKAEDQLGEILVSKNWEKILPFLDLDYEKWSNGFNDQLELFEWISSSRYFNPECFKFENLKHQDKTRNRKRKTYASFVEWLEGQSFKDIHIPTENKQEHLFRGLLHFQEEGYWIERAQPLIRNRFHIEQARNIFNGSDIKEITGLYNLALGKIITRFNKYMKSVVDNLPEYDNVSHYISCQTSKEMKTMFNNWYNSIDKQK